jgi:anti-sigma factor RsiW
MTAHGSPPSDLDLMLYADGELEAERLAEVEAWLSADAAARDKLAGLCTVSRIVREEALEGASGADGLADRIMAAIEEKQERPPAPPPPVAAPVANDNGRRVLFVVATLVAAAAAALLWVRAPGGGPVANHRASAPEAQTVTMGQAHKPPTQPVGVEADVEHGVEVAAVDFGSTTGAVLYVPNGPSHTTTVVWLSDDSDGEDE